jgi:hypothetical protein
LASEQHAHLDVEAAGLVLAKLERAEVILQALAGYLRSEHDVFILTTLFRAIRRTINRARGKDTDWHPPSKPASPAS